MSVEIFEIGGCVRDSILGTPSKDIDFSCIASSFEELREFILTNGMKIVVDTPEFATIRAIAPKSGFRGFQGGLDFVWAREEGPYSDGRRPDWTRPGTLESDIFRRDFTMNALARSESGEIIDLVNGQADIAAGIIRAVGDPVERLTEDALRAVRALRFSVTKGFTISVSLEDAMRTMSVLDAIEDKIADERISDELSKMFRFDTIEAMYSLTSRPALMRAIFSGKVSLDSTLKTRGRGR